MEARMQNIPEETIKLREPPMLPNIKTIDSHYLLCQFAGEANRMEESSNTKLYRQMFDEILYRMEKKKDENGSYYKT